jgi:parallel beta-helix repeat protein
VTASLSTTAGGCQRRDDPWTRQDHRIRHRRRNWWWWRRGRERSSVSGLTFTNNAWGIELNSGSGNAVSGNTAKDNLVGGILLQAENGDTISGNAANNNSAIGIDVAVGSTGNTVSGNAANNDGFGIVVNPGSTANTISANDAHGNPDDDLADLNDACDTNTWTGNTFKTANQTCIH